MNPSGGGTEKTITLGNQRKKKKKIEGEGNWRAFQMFFVFKILHVSHSHLRPSNIFPVLIGQTKIDALKLPGGESRPSWFFSSKFLL